MEIKGICTHVLEIQPEDDPEIGYHTEMCGKTADWDIFHMDSNSNIVIQSIDHSCNEHLVEQIEAYMLLCKVEAVIVEKSGISL